MKSVKVILVIIMSQLVISCGANSTGTEEVLTTSISDTDTSTDSTSDSTESDSESESQNSQFSNTESVVFDGNDGVATVGAASDVFNSANFSKITISLWFKSTDTPNNRDGLFTSGTGNADGTSRLAIYWIDSDTIRCGVDTNSSGSGLKVAYVDIPDRTSWNHVVCTWDSTDLIRIYLNGVVSGHATATGTENGNFTPNSNVYLGRGFSDNNKIVDGYIDEVAIWADTLSANAINSLYNNGVAFDLTEANGNYTSQDSLISWWRMGDADTDGATTITDEKGLNNISLSGNSSIQVEAPQ